MSDYVVRPEKWGFIMFHKKTHRYYFYNSEKQLKEYILKQHIENSVEYRNNILSGNQELSAPLAVYLEISDKCTLKCLHCFKSKYQFYSHTMSLSKIKSVLDELHDMSVFEIRLVGYEAATSPNFAEIVNYIKALGFYIVLNTSAFYGDGHQQRIIDLDFDSYLISLDGIEATHDAIRGSGSYNRVISFIDKIPNKSKIRLNVTISQNNIDQMREMTMLASELGVSIGFAPYRNIGFGRQAGEIQKLTKEDMRYIQQEVCLLRQKFKNTRIILAYHDLLDDTLPYHPIIFSTPCPSRHNISILNNGQVFHCDFLSYIGDKYCGGNVLEASIKEIWNGSYLKKYREIQMNNQCKTCDYYMIRCSGGCASEILETQDLFFDPLCTVHKQCPDLLNTQQSFYDENYFQHGIESGKSSYQNYRWIPERSFQQAEIIKKTLAITKRQILVDFGAAMGNLVRAFNEKGYNMYGIDISPYAISHAEAYKEKLYCSDSLKCLPFDSADWVISIHTLEHLSINQLHSFLSDVTQMRASLFAVVPISNYDGGHYVLEKSEADTSHMLRRSTLWWERTMNQYFRNVDTLDDLSIFGNGCICIKAHRI